MKKYIKFLLFVLLVLCLSVSVFAVSYDGVTVFVDGRVPAFDTEPTIVNDRTMVPLRPIFEALGATVEWDGETSTCTATKGETVVKLTVGADVMYVCGEEKKLDEKAFILNERTMVPLRAVSEAFDCKVYWYGYTRTASIVSDFENSTPLYSLDGRCAVFSNDIVEAQLTVGWYREPLKVLYASDGRSKAFVESEVAAQLTVGWYLWSDLVCERAGYCVYLKRYDEALANWLIPEINTFEDKTSPEYLKLIGKRDEVLKVMRDECGVPYYITGYEFLTHDKEGELAWSNNSTIRFYWFNTSDKEVSNVAFEYVCYNTKGQKVKHELNGDITQNVSFALSLAPGESGYIDYSFNGYPALSGMDFDVKTITYTDGSVWNAR